MCSRLNRAATDTQTILIRDTTAPEFGTVPNVSVTSASNVTSVAVNYDMPAATDAVDQSVEVSCIPAPGSAFDVGDTGVFCTATDDSDNASYASFTVSVSYSTVGTGPFPFLDDFEDGNMDGWDVSRNSFWFATLHYDPMYPPGHPATNKAAVAALCYDVGWCVMEMSANIDPAAQDNATLQLYRYVDSSFDSGEFLSVEAYNGPAWQSVDVDYII